MSVGTLANEGTAYFVDSSSTEISIPAGVYEAVSTGEFTVSDQNGLSFFAGTSKSEICVANGLSAIADAKSVTPTRWASANLTGGAAGKTYVGTVFNGTDYKALASDLSFASSFNGSSWTGTGSYGSPVAPEVVWTTTGDAGGYTTYSLILPTGASQGDLVIIHVGSDASTPATPSGWTALENTTYSDEYGLTIYKVMTATPDTSVGFTGLSEASAMVAFCIRNVEIKDTVLGISNVNAGGTSGMPNNAAITASAGDLILALARLDDDSIAATVTAPAGYENLTVAEAAGLVGQTVMGATKVATGSEDPGAWGGAGDDVWYAVTVRLKANYVNEVLEGLDYANGKYYSTRVSSAGIAVSDDLSVWGSARVSSFSAPVPTYVTRNDTSTSSSNYFTLSTPSNDAGDLLIAIARGQNGFNSVTSSGWNLLFSYNYGGYMQYYYKIATGSTETVGFQPTSSYNWAVVARFRNVDITSFKTNNYASSTNPTYATSPTTANNGLYSTIFCFSGISDANSYQGTSYWTYKYFGGSSSTYGGVGIWERPTKVAPGTIGWAGNESVYQNAYNNNYQNFTIAMTSPKYYSSVAYGAGKYVATGFQTNYSTDGVNFTTISNPITSPKKVKFINGKFWIAGGTQAAYSTNGSSWTVVSVPATSSIVDISTNGTDIKMLSADGSSIISIDGTTWTSIPAPTQASSGVVAPQQLWITTKAGTGGPNSGITFKDKLQKGDLVIAGVTTRNGSSSVSASAGAVMQTAGWTKFSTGSSMYSSTVYGYDLWYKFMGDEPDGGFAVQATPPYMISSTAYSYTYIAYSFAMAIRGVDSTASIFGPEIFSTSTSTSAGSVTVSGPSYVYSLGLGNIVGTSSIPSNMNSLAYAAGDTGYAFASKYLSSGQTFTPSSYSLQTANYPHWQITLGLQLTGAESSDASSSASFAASAYRYPHYLDFGAAGAIQAMKSGETSAASVASDIGSASTTAVAVNKAQLVALAGGKLLFSGSPNESLTLKKIGNAISA